MARGGSAGRSLLAAIGLVAQAAAAQDVRQVDAIAAEAAWAVRVPTIEKVVFRGVVNHDAAGLGAGQIMYPAPNAAGLLAAILTHGLLNEGAKKAQKERMQAEADAVLKPYDAVLATFTNEHLISVALPKLKNADRWRSTSGDAAAGQWLVETAPVFSMTGDQRALVLDNVVRVYRPGGRETADYGQTIRVVSTPIPVPAGDASGDAASVEAVWLGEQGRRLTDESARLFAESLDVALADLASAAARDPAAPARTYRYALGGAEKMERAQPVEVRCDRTLVRTLRGWLLSIPTQPSAAPANCSAEASAPTPR